MKWIWPALFCLGFMILPTPSLACSLAPDFYERWQEHEDQSLRRATVLFRGTIENLQAPDGRYGDVTMTIRTTRTFWGRGAPERVVIPREYFASCARGNLHPAVDGYGEWPMFPFVRNGLGVTLIGRAEDAEAPWNFVILVDNSSDTQRVLRRFRQVNGSRLATP